MPVKKTIVFFLFLLLLISFSNNAICEAYSSRDLLCIITSAPFKSSIKKLPVSGISYKSTIGKKDHIRVRYMGGDPCYDIPKFYLHISTPLFADEAMKVTRPFFISGQHWSLFSLRGPPGSNVS